MGLSCQFLKTVGEKRGGVGGEREGDVRDVLMLFNRHVYSSWYRLHSVAMDRALSSPKWVDNSLAMDSVERRVP